MTEKAHVQRPTCVAVVSANEAISGGDGQRVNQWTVQNTVVAPRDFYKHIHSKKVAYVAANTDKVFSASFDGDVGISKLNNFTATGPLNPYKGHVTDPSRRPQVWAVAASQDGQWALSATNRGEIKLWNPADATKTYATVKASGDPVGGLAFLPKPLQGNQQVLAGHGAGDMILYDILPVGAGVDPVLPGETYRLNATWTFSHKNSHPVNSVAFAITTDGTFGVSGSFDMTVRVWDLATGKLKPPKIQLDDIVWRVAVYSSDPPLKSAKIAIACQDGTVRLFNTDGVSYKDTTNPTNPTDAIATELNGVMGVAFLDKDTVLYTAGNNHTNEIKVWKIGNFTI